MNRSKHSESPGRDGQPKNPVGDQGTVSDYGAHPSTKKDLSLDRRLNSQTVVDNSATSQSPSKLKNSSLRSGTRVTAGGVGSSGVPRLTNNTPCFLLLFFITSYSW